MGWIYMEIKVQNMEIIKIQKYGWKRRIVRKYGNSEIWKKKIEMERSGMEWSMEMG
jgi:hypothetical protein